VSWWFLESEEYDTNEQSHRSEHCLSATICQVSRVSCVEDNERENVMRLDGALTSEAPAKAPGKAWKQRCGRENHKYRHRINPKGRPSSTWKRFSDQPNSTPTARRLRVALSLASSSGCRPCSAILIILDVQCSLDSFLFSSS
jgi:hypothetical protein